MPTKKTAKKKTKKRTTTVKTTSNPQLLHIYCGCLGSCIANPPSVHLSPGDQVEFEATNADVKVHFKNGSPFVSGTVNIKILQGTTSSIETIKPTPPKKFTYGLACSNPRCHTSLDDAEMIIP